MTVEGDSNKSSGEFFQTWGSISRGRALCEESGDRAEAAVAAAASSWAGDVDWTEQEAVLGVSARTSFGDEYRHSRSDFVHVAQRGLSSSHLTLRRRQVRLGGGLAGVSRQDRSPITRGGRAGRQAGWTRRGDGRRGEGCLPAGSCAEALQARATAPRVSDRVTGASKEQTYSRSRRAGLSRLRRACRGCGHHE